MEDCYQGLRSVTASSISNLGSTARDTADLSIRSINAIAVSRARLRDLLSANQPNRGDTAQDVFHPNPGMAVTPRNNVAAVSPPHQFRISG